MALRVFAQPDQNAKELRTIHAGEVFRASQHRLVADRRLWACLGDGWVQLGLGEPGEVYVEECDAPEGESSTRLIVVAPDGLVVRNGLSLCSAVICTVPPGEVVEAVQRRKSEEGVMRLQLAEGGWVSERTAPRRPIGGPGRRLVQALDVEASPRRFRVVATEGLLVREGLQLGSAVVRTIGTGEVFCSNGRRLNREGLMRLRLEDGWVSENARGPGGSAGEILIQPAEASEPDGASQHRRWFRVTGAEGLVVRMSPDLESEVLHTVPFGATVEVTGEEEVCEDLVRTRLATGGWVSERSIGNSGEVASQDCYLEPIPIPEGPRRLWYRVVAPEGLVVRRGLGLNSSILGSKLPKGEIFEVTERRPMPQVACGFSLRPWEVGRATAW